MIRLFAFDCYSVILSAKNLIVRFNSRRKNVQTFTHPLSGVEMIGARLPMGATTQKGDRYDSTTGRWEQFMSPGVKIESDLTVFIRPMEMSAEAQNLLMLLNCHGGEAFASIAELNGVAYVVPSPNFNWDRRIAWLRVRNPLCIEELVGWGYLVVHIRHNREYLLTEAGKKEGQRLLGA